MKSPSELESFLAQEFPRLDLNRPFMGQMSSIEFVELVNALESHFSVKFNLLDLDPERFANAQTVGELLQKSQR